MSVVPDLVCEHAATKTTETNNKANNIFFILFPPFYFNKGSNAENDSAPDIIFPFMKNVGVPSTP